MADRGTLIITPKTKVGELLAVYPDLEPLPSLTLSRARVIHIIVKK